MIGAEPLVPDAGALAEDRTEDSILETNCDVAPRSFENLGQHT
jgi:hypothetical protein